jgi:Fe-S cluster assembly protein SufD
MLDARTHFEAVKAGLPGDAARRADMLVQAEQLGLPTRRQESWHYTDLPQLLKRPLAGSDSEAVEDLPDFSAVTPFAVQFDNGRLTTALPSGETALSVTPFIGFEEIAGGAIAENDAMLLFNAALAGDGLDVQVTGKVTAPLLLKQTGAAATHLRHRIHLAKDAHLTLVELLAGNGYSNNVMHIEAEAGATLSLVRLHHSGRHIGTTTMQLAEAARANIATLVASDDVARHDMRVSLTGSGAHVGQYQAVLAGGAAHIDMTGQLHHLAAGSTSDTRAHYALSGAARGVFQGQVKVARDAQQVDAQMQTRALMLSENAEMDAKPELEIYADDVVCAHGSAIGALDAAALFFLRARGIDAVTARQLLVGGFVREILAQIDHAALADMLDGYLEARIAALVEALPNG